MDATKVHSIEPASGAAHGASRGGPDVRELLFGDLWTYAPAPERNVYPIAERYGHFVDGEFVDGDGWFASINPATEEVVTHVPTADAKVVDRAVAAARNAYETRWRDLPGDPVSGIACHGDAIAMPAKGGIGSLNPFETAGERCERAGQADQA